MLDANDLSDCCNLIVRRSLVVAANYKHYTYNHCTCSVSSMLDVAHLDRLAFLLRFSKHRSIKWLLNSKSYQFFIEIHCQIVIFYRVMQLEGRTLPLY